ncbi:MAG: mannose-1-phosphate guanylyltransferase [candidate division KSB1 bacterium]|nr:mannose-1-phosphate guanylyltransferase [candidate division KSB1 bacterium]MDZ7385241.1 mannose-1-phosphate guanylyltransferase [candidate division KSB1 bacterium]MDZ7393449.1 mannose-1-phosphate guanylyltransferase [candidate division KSB1 bacterium]
MFALIMAGGVGTRFWPRSRMSRPKQVLNIVGSRSMIQDTVGRLAGLVPCERTFVICLEHQRELIAQQLPELSPEHIIGEPRGKDTAPCIGLGALYIRRIDPEAVMVAMPADHVVARERAFRKVLKTAEIIARTHDCLVTIGIQPTYPATGYGYIQHEPKELERLAGVSCYSVKTFAEKPSLEYAQQFIASGDFLWNSGIFVWKVSRILKEIEDKLPELYEGLCEIERHIGKKNERAVIERVYRQTRSISIDYGVMEKSDNIVVLKGDFGWSDVGSWEEVYKLGKRDKQENVSEGPLFAHDASGCYVWSPHKLVALLGVHDLVVVDSEEALLICPRQRSQEVKQLVEAMRRGGFDRYL